MKRARVEATSLLLSCPRSHSTRCKTISITVTRRIGRNGRRSRGFCVDRISELSKKDEKLEINRHITHPNIIGLFDSFVHAEKYETHA